MGEKNEAARKSSGPPSPGRESKERMGDAAPEPELETAAAEEGIPEGHPPSPVRAGKPPERRRRFCRLKYPVPAAPPVDFALEEGDAVEVASQRWAPAPAATPDHTRVKKASGETGDCPTAYLEATELTPAEAEAFGQAAEEENAAFTRQESAGRFAPEDALQAQWDYKPIAAGQLELCAGDALRVIGQANTAWTTVKNVATGEQVRPEARLLLLHPRFHPRFHP